MEREHSEPSVSTPVTGERKGLKSSPTLLKEQHRGGVKDATLASGTSSRTAASTTKRPSVVTTRSLSSGSSVSESNSILSSSESTSSSSMATEITTGDRTSEEDIEDEADEKSSGHTVVTKRQEVDTVFQLAEGQDGLTSRHADDDQTRTSSSTLIAEPSAAAPPSRPVYFSQLPVAQGQQYQHHRQARARPTRYNTFTAVPSGSSSTSPSDGNQTRSRAVHGGVPSSSSTSGNNNRAHSTSPRNTLSRSVTTSAIPSMGAANNHFMHSTASTSPPQQFPGTSSVAPPIPNTASVTFAPVRARSYSTSASGVTSPTSPAFESMAAINIEAMRKSPSSSTGSSASPPPAPLASHNALFNATSGSSNSSTMHGKSVSAGYEAATTSLTNASNGSAANFASSGSNNSSSSSAVPLSPPHPSTTSSASNRRHTIDPYFQRNNNNNSLDKSLDNSTPLPNIPAGHRRHHQSISVPPSSSSEYSSLGDLQSRQASHLHQLSNSRYRKSSLGSQALLSPTALDHMTSPSASILAAVQNGSSSSSSRAQQWDQHAHRGHHGVDSGNGGPQLSPTRSRNDPYLSTSPRYSSRASHEAQRNNQLEAKIVLLGRQGVGKTSLVHRYITGKFSSTLPMTIGASFLVKKLDFEGGIKVRLQIWDTAGQERFRSMAPMYYRGAHAAILVYDLTNDDSLADIQVWLDELRRNMSSDLIVHIVGNKADLAHTSRKITLEDAKRQISEWIARPPPSDSSIATSSNLNAPQTRRSTSGGHTTSTSKSADEGSPVAPARSGMVSLGSFNLSRSNTRAKLPEEVEPSLPAFKDWGLEEVSAKEDDGIDMLFATIAGKLVERKHQIEQERVLRTKDSIMITDEMKGKADDPTRVWGCC